MKSLDELARDEAEEITRLLPESYWRQVSASYLADPTRSQFHDKQSFIEYHVIGGRLLRDQPRLKTNQAYKALDPTHQFEQLVTISFDKKSFAPSMIDSLVKSLRQKCPKCLDYDLAIIRPEFNASSSLDPSFNPHVHIYTPKVVKQSLTHQAFSQRFISCKKPPFPIYNVNVVQAPAPAHKTYIVGDKSTTEKIGKIEKDRKYRESQNPPIPETYALNQN